MTPMNRGLPPVILGDMAPDSHYRNAPISNPNVAESAAAKPAGSFTLPHHSREKNGADTI